ncbi:MAG: hypothetical protein C0480_02920 [Bradyrhizobium sp.]|nr:hypothetical protein [Bradyrhizobium sp.]
MTFLIEPSDHRLRTAPLLAQTADRWLDALTSRVRHCIVCSTWLQPSERRRGAVGDAGGHAANIGELLWRLP